MDLCLQLDNPRVAFSGQQEQCRQFLLGFRQAPTRAATDGDATAQRAAQRAQHVDIGGRAGGVVAGALVLVFIGGSELRLDHVRQLEILEEVVHEFFARQLEGEIVFVGLIVVACLAASGSTAAFRAGHAVAFQIFGITG